MAEFNLSNATTTNLRDIPDFIVSAIALDVSDPDNKETYWYFSEATKNFGYYLTIPEIHSAANALATWAFTRGWDVIDDIELRVQLEAIQGAGDDSFQTIMWNHEVVKLIVGDAFAEIVRNKDKSRLLNLVPISPERVRLVFVGSMLKRYDVWNGRKWKAMRKEQILHSSNNRIGDQMHGTSKLDAARFIIDFRNELLEDTRKLSHRDMALGIAYYKTNNVGKITYVNAQIEQAVKNGEMLGVPEGTVEIKEFPSKNPTNKLELIRYTGDFFYQIFGVPRSIVSSDGTTEVGGKMGHIIFEPIYTKEQTEEESNLWNQVGIRIKFNRPPSLGGLMQQNEAKNTGQTRIQPNDVAATTKRE